MTDAPTPSPSPGFDKLSSEIRRLGNVLGAVISKLEGQAMLNLEERIRQLAKARRADEPGAAESLALEVRQLDAKEAYEMAMAFSTYFELVNLAEENYRIQLLRERRKQRRLDPTAPPLRESIEAAVIDLKKAGVNAQAMQQLVNQLNIELVFTAHPTESKRRTMLTKLQRLAQSLRSESGMQPSWSFDPEEDMEREITSLWLTDRSRTNKPEVTDEVKTGMWYFDIALWDTLPRLQYDLERALAKHYPGVTAPQRWLTFGSWIGGDRDGNPNVTPSITASVLAIHRRLAIDKLSEGIHEASRLLSVSSKRDGISNSMKELLRGNEQISEHVKALAARYPNEPHRLVLAGLRAELQRAFDQTSGAALLEASRKPLPHSAPPAGSSGVSDAPKGIITSKHITHTLDTISDSLKRGRGAMLADGELRRLQQQVSIFGTHMAHLDIRQHSGKHEDALALLLKTIGVHDNYLSLDEAGRVELLTKLFQNGVGELSAKHQELPEALDDILGPIRVVNAARALYGQESIGIYIISMADALSDVLELLFFMEWCGTPFDIAPLFETMDDLDRAPEILGDMFSHPYYRRHLRRRGDRQNIMVGYSDSNKDCGYVMANWALFKAQENIVRVCRRTSIKVSLFHGRGGSIARGGGPAAQAILAQPCGLCDGAIRITEQGEVLSTRYHDPDLAHRILEQMAYGVLLGTYAAQKPAHVSEEWRNAMQDMSDASFTAYAALVHKDPDFITFWKSATPIDEISTLRLGSRPSFRKATRTVEDLRAIPWVFSWTQSRCVFPGWFGLGSALNEVLKRDDGKAMLQAMYKGWAFFTTVIDNAQLTLVKADMKIAALYADLVPDEAIRMRIFGIIKDEYDLTIKSILEVTGQQGLLDNEPVLRRSVELRNPYVDPLNYIQVESIRRLRGLKNTGTQEEADLREVIELTISGVSGGLRNTG
ncbi:MAG: phosphoenolpyruvate carboxylase [Candidatus Methylacidiphilales bacterium]|nr:phosphoenolpyruvate carboxylase [Candidatus Methylacidiphilales bacterium]